MGLFDEMKNEKARPNATCTVKKVLNAMTKKERDELQAALDDMTIQAVAISRVLERRGVELKADTIRRHRKRDCRCG